LLLVSLLLVSLLLVFLLPSFSSLVFYKTKNSLTEFNSI
jgi:type II secretory pathway pseudopilin PulG